MSLDIKNPKSLGLEKLFSLINKTLYLVDNKMTREPMEICPVCKGEIKGITNKGNEIICNRCNGEGFVKGEQKYGLQIEKFYVSDIQVRIFENFYAIELTDDINDKYTEFSIEEIQQIRNIFETEKEAQEYIDSLKHINFVNGYYSRKDSDAVQEIYPIFNVKQWVEELNQKKDGV